MVPPTHGVKRRCTSKAGLLYIFVELYLDDKLVYATKAEVFLERIRIVLERFFRQFDILKTLRSVTLVLRR